VESRFGINPAGLRGKDKEAPADGPARVVKPGDWGAVPDQAMKGFQMAAFSMPGRAQPKPNPMETKLAELARDARKAEDAHKLALQKVVHDGEAAAKAAQARGREEGLREGEKRAWEKYEKELGVLRNNAAVALDILQQEKAVLFLEFEGQVLELLSASIHRVFGAIANEHAEAVLPMLKKAVAALGQVTVVTLKVNPSDFATAKDNQDFWLPVDAGLKDIRIVSDERIAKGGCFVESDSTSVGLQATELAERIDEELKRIFLAKAQALRGPEALPAPEDSAASGESPASEDTLEPGDAAP
jgi:flagellar biosynthesis/type III secretory pathway protein FliH